jgi:hypothetical protein
MWHSYLMFALVCYIILSSLKMKLTLPDYFVSMNQTQVQGQEKSWKAIRRELTLYLDRQKNIAWFGKFGILVSHQSSNW